MTDAETQAQDAPDAEGWEWSIVEIFDHRRHVGRSREEERFGAKMMRVDIPKIIVGEDGALSVDGWVTHYYGGAAIFSFSLTDEATVMRANKPYTPPARLTYSEPDEDGEFREF